MKVKMASRDKTRFGRAVGEAFVLVEQAMRELEQRNEDTSSEYTDLMDIFNDLHNMWTSVRFKDKKKAVR